VRHSLLDLGVIDVLFKYTRTTQIFAGEELKNIAWLLCNLSMIKREEEKFRSIFPFMRSIFCQKDREMINKIGWVYANLSNTSDERIMKEMIDEGTLKLIVHHLGSTDYYIKLPTLRAIGNILCGPANVTEKAIEFGLLEHIESMIDARKTFIRRESMWAISNVLADGPQFIEKVIETSIFIKLLNAIIMDIDQIKAEAIIAFINALKACDLRQAKIIVRLGLSKILAQAFTSANERLVTIGLNCAEAILEKGKQIQDDEQTDINPFRVDLESEGTIHHFEKLQYHRSDAIYTKVSQMIDTYFETLPQENQ